MCGRFSLTAPAEDVVLRFLLAVGSLPTLEPRLNVSPGQDVLAVQAVRAGRAPAWLRWGLVPAWADPARPGPINARIETAGSRPMFREALRRRRCLVPADGFYEWRREGTRRLPVRFQLADGGLFALAGLWEERATPQGTLRTVCVLTTAPNGLVATVHDRMPVLLRPEFEVAWLTPGTPDPELLSRLAKPYPETAMAALPVDPALLRPPGPIPPLLT